MSVLKSHLHAARCNEANALRESAFSSEEFAWRTLAKAEQKWPAMHHVSVSDVNR